MEAELEMIWNATTNENRRLKENILDYKKLNRDNKNTETKLIKLIFNDSGIKIKNSPS